MRLIPFFLLLLTVKVATWECGSGFISSRLSFVIAAPFDKRYVNRCFQAHDENYDRCGYWEKRYADDIFCDCLNNSDSWWTRWITKPIFCTAVRMLTAWHGLTERCNRYY
ncbi:unnamed protein product [Caenorhabditis nigoni]